ncbi:hypothetical protein LCM10_12610 [Rossellomorea aquimaris]|uniref:hypothetical protein n=1 Tax=Rossellomorea aquimaris TaxID=189382 RepID=UPI001CD58A53|nr:hypothetical protein [Rossellomorea aquimaris]MCA1055831.1 hypothetical protein [Rossellomorea aquimaris]
MAKKWRIVFNLFLILCLVTIGIVTFPDPPSQYAFFIAGIGSFMTFPLLMPTTSKRMRIGLLACFVIAFALLFSVTYWG